MSNRIYAVVSHDDILGETIEMCFRNRADAEDFKEELEENNEVMAFLSNRCKECDGNNKDCPFWVESFEIGNGCENRTLPFGGCAEYTIVETELIEDGEKDQDNS